ncbi:unnamed protein product [Gadus morhua 'NCC']
MYGPALTWGLTAGDAPGDKGEVVETQGYIPLAAGQKQVRAVVNQPPGALATGKVKSQERTLTSSCSSPLSTFKPFKLPHRRLLSSLVPGGVLVFLSSHNNVIAAMKRNELGEERTVPRIGTENLRLSSTQPGKPPPALRTPNSPENYQQPFKPPPALRTSTTTENLHHPGEPPPPRRTSASSEILH